MPLWWEKPSSKDIKQKTKRRSFVDALHLKFNNLVRGKNLSRSGRSERYTNDTLSEKGLALPRSESPSSWALRCQSFNEHIHAYPPPLQQLQHSSVGTDDSRVTVLRLELNERSTTLPDSLLSNTDKQLSFDAWDDLASAIVSSNTSMDTDDQPDSQLLSPLVSDYESGNITTVNSPSRIRHKDQSLIVTQQISKEKSKPVNLSSNNHIPLPSKKRRPSSTHVTELQIPSRSVFFSAPDNSISTPLRSPLRDCGPEQVIRLGFCSGMLCSDVNLVGSWQCSSPGSGQNSGDMSLFSPLTRCSPESSPIPSPRMTSPVSQRQCGVVSSQHPWAGGLATGLSTDRPGDRKAQYHKLPLPPMTAHSCSFPSSYLRAIPPTLTRNPGCPKTLTSTVSCWKKGRLIGSGTYGHVYLGFNSEIGEMCAMKEVPLFYDDTKSKESVQQLEQEINMLSCLRHPNIVGYFGSQMVDEKLYIYLEYVSGGSIHKLLQDYGQLGESAIRSYTQQILSGLAYLHSKKTVHRDIKGANILVDPTGRVKLADFGTAKHITGQPCPLSFKGSPYWMAPEVIINSNGCNLAVDIWSLGCTIIEMATAKPPWSQYEGVAALFKIGNSKELPTIPDHISEEGKDFVRQCLQRNPLHRPTAAELLQHPFVTNVAPLKRSLISSELLEFLQPISDSTNYMDIRHRKRFSCLETQLSRGFKIGSVSSDGRIPKHLSCPVSPIHSPLLHPKSSQTTLNRMRSPSAVFGPHTVSASSTPYTGGAGALPTHHFSRLMASNRYELSLAQRPQNILYANGSLLPRKPRLESETFM